MTYILATRAHLKDTFWPHRICLKAFAACARCMPLRDSSNRPKLAFPLFMSQVAGTAGRPRQDGPPGRGVAPANTPMIPAIGSKKDIGMVLQPRHHAVSKAVNPAKVCSANTIALKPRFCCPLQAASYGQITQMVMGHLHISCNGAPHCKRLESLLTPTGTHSR